MHLAVHTLNQINSCLEKDQGAAYREQLKLAINEIEDAYRGPEEIPFRTHLGASLIGRECARELWLSFRWAARPFFVGRLLRLFNRGHLEEARIIALLRTAGFYVWQNDPQSGKQYRIIDHTGHFGGSGDGIGYGILDIPQGNYCVLEFKTHNKKSYDKLVKEGVKSAKPEHYAQMQCYMRKMGFAYALYVGVCKDDDSLHMEIVLLDPETADMFLMRGSKIVMLQQAPERISQSQSSFKCKWCDKKDVCFNKAPMEINCRTCKYASPNNRGSWDCSLPANPRNDLTPLQQYHACEHHNPIQL